MGPLFISPAGEILEVEEPEIYQSLVQLVVQMSRDICKCVLCASIRVLLPYLF